jgi:hypothetical protein
MDAPPLTWMGMPLWAPLLVLQALHVLVLRQ